MCVSETFPASCQTILTTKDLARRRLNQNSEIFLAKAQRRKVKRNNSNFAAWRLGERHPIPFRTEESAQAAQICRHRSTKKLFRAKTQRTSVRPKGNLKLPGVFAPLREMSEPFCSQSERGGTRTRPLPPPRLYSLTASTPTSHALPLRQSATHAPPKPAPVRRAPYTSDCRCKMATRRSS